MTNCPNCAAPLKGGRCEYCGTQVEPPRRVLVTENCGSMVEINAECIRLSCFGTPEDLSKYPGGLCRTLDGRIV